MTMRNIERFEDTVIAEEDHGRHVFFRDLKNPSVLYDATFRTWNYQGKLNKDVVIFGMKNTNIDLSDVEQKFRPLLDKRNTKQLRVKLEDTLIMKNQDVWQAIRNLWRDVRAQKSKHIPDTALRAMRSWMPDEFWEMIDHYDLEGEIYSQCFMLCCMGDQTARAQFLKSFPIGGVSLMGNTTISDNIDKRLPIKDVIQKYLKMDNSSMSNFMYLQKIYIKSKIIALNTNEHINMCNKGLDITWMKEIEDVINFKHTTKLIKGHDSHEHVKNYLIKVFKKYPYQQWLNLNDKFKYTIDNVDYFKEISRSFIAMYIEDKILKLAPQSYNAVGEIFRKILRGENINDIEKNILDNFKITIGDYELPREFSSIGYISLYSILERCSVKKIDEFSKKWHRMEREITSKVSGDENFNVTWEPIIGSRKIDNELSVREITSKFDLVQQGNKEEHCVGSYLGRIIGREKENNVIFSIEKNDKILSTLDIIITRQDDKFNVEISQNRASRNQPPTREALEAGRVVKDMISDMSVAEIENYFKINEEIRSTHNAREYLKFAEKIRFNIFIPGEGKRFFDSIRPLLPKNVRNKDFNDILPDLEGIIPEYYFNNINKKLIDMEDRFTGVYERRQKEKKRE